jgi:tetratricopeptide (TPR) repeat protein
MTALARKNFPQKDIRSKKATKEAASYSPWFKPWAMILAVIAATSLVFSNSITGNFLAFDDFDYIINNPYIKSLSWGSIKNIFTVFYYANYHPLTTIFFAVEHNVFGVYAPAYHVINLLIHLVNVGLVYILFQKLGLRKEIAAVGALFFGIHPMHVESVSWISERKDVLYSLFYIGGLISYLNYLQREKTVTQSPPFSLSHFPTFSFFLFLLSLLSKPAANTFPLLLVLFDVYFINLRITNNTELRITNVAAFRISKKFVIRRLIEKIPFFFFSIVFGIITVLAQHAGGALTDISRPIYTLVERFFVVFYALTFYIVRFFLPVDLCALQYAPKELSIFYYISPLLIIFIVWMVFSKRFQAVRQQLIFGLLFYLFTIILVVQIIPIGYVNVSERYSYIPYIGLLFIVGSFYQNLKEASKKQFRYLIITVAIVFAIISFQRNKIWHDTLSLFTDNSEKNPQSSQAQFVLGEKQYESGDINGSLVSYTRSIELDSTVGPVYFWRGNAYGHLENYQAAITDYLKAAQLKPGYLEAYNNIGTLYMKQNDYANAIIYFSKCMALKPSEFLYQNRATSYFYLKKYKEAIDDYTMSLQINSSLSDAYFNRGVCYLYLQQIDLACADWKKASAMGYEKAAELMGKYCKTQ